MEWKPIDTAPLDRDLELAVIDSKETRVVALVGLTPKPANEFITYSPHTGEIG
jgi:hypothetical protein